MEVLVSDTSVLVDLGRGDLLEAAFKLPVSFAVPDLLYERELKDYEGPQLLKLGLRVHELDDSGVSLAQDYRHRNSRISLVDGFALSLATKLKSILLTGDEALRALGEADGIECHGLLWLIDFIAKEGVATNRKLHQSLTAIASHPRNRLPKREVQERLKRYKK